MDQDQVSWPLEEEYPEVRVVPEGVVEGAPSPGLNLLGDDGATPEAARDLLTEVIDPEIGIDIVNLGLLRSVKIDGSHAKVEFTVTTPACPLSSYIENEIRTCLWQLPGLEEIDVECVYTPAWTPEDMTEEARAALGWG